MGRGRRRSKQSVDIVIGGGGETKEIQIVCRHFFCGEGGRGRKRYKQSVVIAIGGGVEKRYKLWGLGNMSVTT